MTYEDKLLQYETLVAAQAVQIQDLKAQINTLQKLIFGQKSERFVNSELSPDQMGLFSGEPPEMTIPKVQEISYERKEKKKHTGRQPLPDHLPVDEVIIEPKEDVRGLKYIGKEVTDTLDYQPATLKIIRYIRHKYVERGASEDRIVIGQLPSRPINKGIAQAGLLSHLFVSKFVDHLPFYRQIKMFKRDHKVDVSQSTLNDWFINCCTLLEPLYCALKQKVISCDYLQADESPIKVLASEKKGKTHQGYQWVYHDIVEGLVLFNYRKGRGKHGPKEILKDYQGYLQCDGWHTYDLFKSTEGITLVGCLVHARRKFIEAQQSDAERSATALEIFKAIYSIERKYKALAMPTEKDDSNRNGDIQTLLVQLKEWIDAESNKILPKSPIGKAMTYFIRQWPKLKNVTLDSIIQLDNNLIENKIRPLALGRKNYLFAGNHASAQRIAMMYSFFATCQIHNVNPWEWLKDVLSRLPDHPINQIDQLLPNIWKPIKG